MVNMPYGHKMGLNILLEKRIQFLYIVEIMLKETIQQHFIMIFTIYAMTKEY